MAECSGNTPEVRVVASEQLLALGLEESRLLVDGDRVQVDVGRVEHVAEDFGACIAVLDVCEDVFENHCVSVLV